MLLQEHTHSQEGAHCPPPWTQRPWPRQISRSLVPPPGALHLWDLALGEELEAREASSIFLGPEIPGKLNFIVP